MPRYHRLIRLRANAHHAIETLAEQIDAAVGAADLQPQIRVTRHELPAAAARPGGATRMFGMSTRMRPVSEASILAKQALDLVHVRQQILAAFVQHQAVLRRLHLARGALQQARAEQGFQRLHMLGHRRARQPQTLAGEGETRQLR